MWPNDSQSSPPCSNPRSAPPPRRGVFCCGGPCDDQVQPARQRDYVPPRPRRSRLRRLERSGQVSSKLSQTGGDPGLGKRLSWRGRGHRKVARANQYSASVPSQRSSPLSSRRRSEPQSEHFCRGEFRYPDRVLPHEDHEGVAVRSAHSACLESGIARRTAFPLSPPSAGSATTLPVDMGDSRP
jgi:hypothetical protein